MKGGSKGRLIVAAETPVPARCGNAFAAPFRHLHMHWAVSGTTVGLTVCLYVYFFSMRKCHLHVVYSNFCPSKISVSHQINKLKLEGCALCNSESMILGMPLDLFLHTGLIHA
jgi:hypothetical protein